MLDLFDELSLWQRSRHMLSGLRAPRDSGAYKMARTEAQRMSAPLAAVAFPLLVALALIFIRLEHTEREREVAVDIIEAESPETLERLEEVFEPPPDFEPPEVSVFTDVPMVAPPAPTPETQVVQRPDNFADVSMIRSPVVLRGLFSSRTEEGRAEALRRHAGEHAGATEAAVFKALMWLKRNQLEDGSWRGSGSARSKTAMTGLGLLAFLAHGETPSSPRFGPTVRRALQFLVETDQRDNGTFRHTEGGSRGGVYAHGIASYALSEAFALTNIPMIREAMEKAVCHIVRGQRPDGGFDYRFARDGGARDRCTSVAGWMAQAMKAAHMAGARVDDLEKAMDRAAIGFKKQYRDSGHFLYASKSGGTRHSMTPIGVLCLQLLGHGQSPEARGGLAAISEWEASWTSPNMRGGILEPVYVWYYAAQAFFHQGGNTWERWNDIFAPELVEHQNEDGSWTFEHGRSANYGPVYHTTLNALSLMVYYRYLPTYQTPEAVETYDTVEDEDDIEIEIMF